MNLKYRIEELETCLERFKTVLKLEKDDVVRDSAVKRFELCFELIWIILKDFLHREGLTCRSPRECIREAFSIGLTPDGEVWLDMLEDRNLSVHSYDDGLADSIYSRLETYLQAMEDLLKGLKEKVRL
ncbi:MAG: nucleotidyltransferase [Aquificae bacterium]|nr:nucleotidyltransferase [Aquificota bacterium]